MKQPELIFIPGWGMEKQVWDPLLPYFQEYSVWHVEWRGVKELSEFAERVAEAAREQDVILIGWSLGALAALQACDRVRVKGLILIGGTAKFTVDENYESGWKLPFVERMKRSLVKRKDDTLERFYKSMFTKQEIKDSEQFEDIAERFQGDSIESLQLGLDYLIEMDMRSQLKYVKMPVLLLHGEQDAICPLSAARYIQENTNGALKVINGAGHALCVTDSEYCANEIIQFVEVIQNDQQNVITKTI
ncbi:alpha/beta fold hydrolase [Bacillus pseudomycoides]|uniref:Transporter n=1 Tax=Bacillus pseudomycoides TaxID=64104 RepID=A0A2B5HHZ8_9BACI|nr:alpha/beta fold hydrolase [Bacillus pseudomycoides]PDY48979.1 transporter [Bacillus pseudomycoides]PEA85311.1 transporter [Bacillus pseudomycoides]PED09901.1 transporter [Bacillus pseudomycoides]PED70873.1 transporter [Bacillus pseudomycoides]PEI40211.1 transporter [Bacillus pseudomycoides]